MKISNALLQELKLIMKEEYGEELSPTDLEKLAYSLVGYFGLLLKAKVREGNKTRFGNSSASRIDNTIQKDKNKKEKK